MSLRSLRFSGIAVVSALALTACGGGGVHQSPPISSASPAQKQTASAQSLADSYGSASKTRRATAQWGKIPCPFLPALPFSNPPWWSPTPIPNFNVPVFAFSYPQFPGCQIKSGTIYGVTAYQSAPAAPSVNNIPLGQFVASNSGKETILNFTPAAGVSSFNVPVNTTVTVVAGLVPSPTAVTLPVIPNTTLTMSEDIGDGTGVALSFSSATGTASMFSADCHSIAQSAIPASMFANVVTSGKLSGYCAIAPNGGSETLGGLLSVALDNPNPDGHFIEWDGTPTAGYGSVSSSGNTFINQTPAITLPAVQNMLILNTLDFEACAPAQQNLDCNPEYYAAANQSVPGTAKTSVSVRSGEFQVLVSDDYRYRPQAAFGTSTAPWSGLFYVSSIGPNCSLSTGPDNENGDVPPPPPGLPPSLGLRYTDISSLSNGTGPFAEYDIKPTLPAGAANGSCNITFTEDPVNLFVTTLPPGFNNGQPLSPRSTTVSLTVTP